MCFSGWRKTSAAEASYRDPRVSDSGLQCPPALSHVFQLGSARRCFEKRHLRTSSEHQAERGRAGAPADLPVSNQTDHRAQRPQGNRCPFDNHDTPRPVRDPHHRNPADSTIPGWCRTLKDMVALAAVQDDAGRPDTLAPRYSTQSQLLEGIRRRLCLRKQGAGLRQDQGHPVRSGASRQDPEAGAAAPLPPHPDPPPLFLFPRSDRTTPGSGRRAQKKAVVQADAPLPGESDRHLRRRVLDQQRLPVEGRKACARSSSNWPGASGSPCSARSRESARPDSAAE